MLETYLEAKRSGHLGSWRARLAARTAYRLRVLGADELPRAHGALLVSNRVSLCDSVLVARAVRHALGPRSLSRLAFLNGSKETRCASAEDIERARELLQQGYLVCLFAEVELPRQGRLLRFAPTLERIARGIEVPIVPVAIDVDRGPGLLHRAGKTLRWQWPRRFPFPATVCCGARLPPTTSAFRSRLAVQELQAHLFERNKTKEETLPAKFLRAARRFPFRQAMTDHSGKRLRFLGVLAGALVLRRLLKTRVIGEERVGILLPPSIAGTLANVALSLLGKVIVNLNYSVSRENLRLCQDKARISTVVTSRVFLKKIGWEDLEGTLCLEELLEKVSPWAKLQATLIAILSPTWLLRRLYCKPTDPDSAATILFSSGSTGDPKGVVLSHFNILSNIRGATQVFDLKVDDRVVGVLPFFHAFGYTAILWLPLTVGLCVLYHPTPREGKAIGRLIRRERGTLLVCPPTFFQIYLRQCQPEDLRSLRYAIAGAEKLKPTLARAFEERFDIPLLEGYGTTELSPAVSLNIPESDDSDEIEMKRKANTVGHPLPGVAVKVVDLETGEDLDAGEEGLIYVKGANVMLGYLEDPERTAKVLRDGWYVTGDVGRIDESGFIEITDRLSRFSKLGGEMVPHLKVEEELQEVAREVCFAVSAIADERKGERLVVLHTPLPEGVTADTLQGRLRERGLPNLFIPRQDSFIEIDEIPVLPSGKLDLRGIRDIAQRKLLETE